MRGSLIDRPSLSLGQARALLVRHMVYSCILIACVAMGARIMSRWYHPRRADSAAHLQGVTKTLALCRSELERFERLRDWLTQAKESRGRPRRILMSLGGTLPEDVWINVVTAEGNDVTVVGSSTTEAALSTFLERLVSQGLLERVRLDASRETVAEKQGTREFSISGGIAAPRREEEVLRESRQ
jgi:Tfp pilus assembly protein PilN